MASDPQSTRRVLLLASYCDDDDARCTDSTPCRDCLDLCTVADLRGGVVGTQWGMMGHLRAEAADGDPLPPLEGTPANAR